MERHLATQLIISHDRPSEALSAAGEIIVWAESVGAAVKIPSYVNNSVVVSLFAVGSEEFLDTFASKVEEFCLASRATTSVLSLLEEETA